MAIRPERNRWKETALVKGRVKEYWNGRAGQFSRPAGGGIKKRAA